MTGVRDPQRSGDSSEESRKERIDRELMELLNELRVALPGVQFLFALPQALITGGLVAALLGWLWIGSPALQRARGSRTRG